MKVFSILSVAVTALVTVVAATEKEGACHADNCARHITGTGGHLLPSATRMADCSKFQLTTVTPKAVTTTVTVTVDGDEPAKFRRARRDLEARADEPAVPTYATKECEDSSSRYASACSCWGITATTSTAPTPTKTETVTETVDYCDDL